MRDRCPVTRGDRWCASLAHLNVYATVLLDDLAFPTAIPRSEPMYRRRSITLEAYCAMDELSRNLCYTQGY